MPGSYAAASSPPASLSTKIEMPELSSPFISMDFNAPHDSIMEIAAREQVREGLSKAERKKINLKEYKLGMRMRVQEEACNKLELSALLGNFYLDSDGTVSNEDLICVLADAIEANALEAARRHLIIAAAKKQPAHSLMNATQLDEARRDIEAELARVYKMNPILRRQVPKRYWGSSGGGKASLEAKLTRLFTNASALDGCMRILTCETSLKALSRVSKDPVEDVFGWLRTHSRTLAERSAAIAQEQVRQLSRQMTMHCAERHVQEVKKLLQTFRNGREGLLEEIPYLFALYLEGKTIRDPRTLEELYVYSRGKWGSTFASKARASLGVSAFVLFLSALIAGQHAIASFLLPMSSIAMGLSLTMAMVHSRHEQRLWKILTQPSNTQLLMKSVKNVFKALLIPVAMVMIVFHGKELAATGRGAKFLVPFIGWSLRQTLLFMIGQCMSTYTQLKAHLNNGINPLRSSTFYIALMDNYIGGLNMAYFVGSESRTYSQPSAQAVLRRLYNSQVLALAVNQFVKHSKFLFTGQRVDTRYSVFALCWSFTGGVTAKLILNTLLNFVDIVFGRISKAATVAASVVMSVSENYVIQSLKAAACVKFVQAKMTYFQAIMSLRLRDLRFIPREDENKKGIGSSKEAQVSPVVIQSRNCMLPDYNMCQ